MTSEILQLFTQGLEMLISWSSFDCILDSRTCNVTDRTIMVKPMKTTLYNILLRMSTPWVNGPVQFIAVLHLKGFLSSRLGEAESFLMKCTLQFCFLSYLEDAIYGVEEVWYFTNAIAASSLQNSSNTITPSSNVMWSIIGPSGSKPSNRFLTNRSLGVNSGIRWIRTIRSPTTLTITEKRDLQPEARFT